MQNNGTLFQFFHWYYPADGSLWQKLAKKVSRLHEIGVTAVWMPPAFKGSKGAESGGYDVYDLYDLGEFDQKGSVRTKYGLLSEYRQAIDALHAAGIQAYADIILNHLCGADSTEKIKVRKVNPDNRNEFISGEESIEAETRFSFPGRNGKYSLFQWDYQCFSGVDYAKDRNEKAIFSILNQYGEGWEQVADTGHGNYDFLLGADIEYRNPFVREELKRWAEWYWQQTKFDGIRMDAVKHVNPDFICEWMDHLRSASGRNLFAVGEYWAPEKLQDMLHFIELTEGRMSLFDAPLHHNFFNAGRGKKDYDLRTILDNTLTASRPELSVTLVGNHDTQPGQLLESWIEPWFKPLAYSLILLRNKGYPCVFYPDLYGARYTTSDDNGKKREIVLEPVPHLEQLIKLRSKYAYGQQRDFFDSPTCIGWTLDGDADHPGSGCAVIIASIDKASIKMEIGKQHSGKKFQDYLGNSKNTIQIGDDGWAEFSCEHNFAVWVQKG
ncbi:MAG: alpha-amylase [Pseudobacter sp.]|uniref:alpha-amylase n=1 Tax=Pseudobacter sp. TaxID=2045420 RepID=UPI003F7DD1E0